MIKSQLIMRYTLLKIQIIMVTLLSACSSVSTESNIHYGTHVIDVKDNSLNNFEKIVCNTDVKSRIMNQYANWKGVRYRLGGSSKKGIDCSAFVQRTFREQFGLELPRSTYEQQGTGESISRSNLRIGDLVLFHVGSTSRHVGIYIGNNQFVHVSTRNGVMISNINEPYWKKRYNRARRVLTRS